MHGRSLPERRRWRSPFSPAPTASFSGGIGARAYGPSIVEIGYWVKAGARGRGVATRALALLARWAFDELGAARVELRAEPDNVGSQRVAEKAGFTREGVLRSVLDFKGRRRDAVMFSLLPGDICTPAGGPPRASLHFRA